jgi:uncharacterized protein YecT (DUF1311 family)
LNPAHSATAAIFEHATCERSLSNQVRLGCLAFLLTSTPAGATNDAVQACLDKITGGEQKQCTERLYRGASDTLDAVYRSVVEHASKSGKGGGSSQAAAITASQKAWQAYRDAECTGVVGNSDGSGTQVWHFGCLAEKTLERIQELQVPFNQR